MAAPRKIRVKWLLEGSRHVPGYGRPAVGDFLYMTEVDFEEHKRAGNVARASLKPKAKSEE